jgi:DNA-binding transcriptional MerR regulator
MYALFMTDKEKHNPFISSREMTANLKLYGVVFKSNRLFNEREYTVGDTDVSYRVISHWSKNNVLPDGVKGTKGWHKFSFTELLWLKLIAHLRNFGFSLKKIASIKEQIMVYDKKNDVYPLLELPAVQALRLDVNPCLVVLADGRAGIADTLEIELVKHAEKQDMLLIPIKSIFTEMGITAKKATFLIPLRLDEKQLNLLSYIADGKFDSILIKLKNGKIERIEKTKNEGAVEESYERVREIIKAGGYQRIVLETVDGTTIKLETTTKEK